MEMPVKCNVLKICKVADTSREGMTKIQGYRVVKEDLAAGREGKESLAADHRHFPEWHKTVLIRRDVSCHIITNHYNLKLTATNKENLKENARNLNRPRKVSSVCLN